MQVALGFADFRAERDGMRCQQSTCHDTETEESGASPEELHARENSIEINEDRF